MRRYWRSTRIRNHDWQTDSKLQNPREAWRRVLLAVSVEIIQMDS